MNPLDLARRTWWEAEPHLLGRERAAVSTAFPELVWSAEGPGSWTGSLPPWPFKRPAPANLEVLLGDAPFEVRVHYSHAFPAAPPAIFPLAPEPAVHIRSFTTHHVLGDGSLCLLRDADQWTTSSSTTDLILKAAGWRIEYALFEHAKLDSLTENGIVIDDRLDQLIVSTIEELRGAS